MAGTAGNWPLFGRIKRKGERRMEEALAGYIVFLKEQERSETTVNKYRHDIETFLAWNMHAPVTKERVISYKHWLTERYAPASVNSMLAALNGFLRYAGHGACTVKALRMQRQMFCQEERKLTRGEYQRLLAAAKQKSIAL